MISWFSIRVQKSIQWDNKFFFFQYIMLDQDHHTQKNESGPLPYTVTKINSKWTNYLSIRAKNLKLLEEGIGRRKPSWPWIWLWILRYEQQKKKIDKWTLSQNFFCNKGYYQNGEKTTYRMGETIFNSYIWLRVSIQNI